MSLIPKFSAIAGTEGSNPSPSSGESCANHGRPELHTMTEENGVMKMRPLSAIEVKADAEASLQPGGMHLMLMGLTRTHGSLINRS